MNILHVVSDGYSEFNSSRWRCTDQADAIVSQKLADVRIIGMRHWLYQTQDMTRAMEWCDIAIIHRVLTTETHKQIEYWRSRGKSVVLDGDDHYEGIESTNASYKFWGNGLVQITTGDGYTYEKQMETHPITQFRRGLQLCTASTSPSELLCKDWSKYAPSFHIPNYLNRDTYTFPSKKQLNKDQIVVGWGGSLSHTQSFENSGVMEAMRRVMGKRKNVYMLIVGDKRVVDMLPLPKERILYLHYVKWSEWPRLVNSWYDIGIAPLAGEYDMRRSWIKPLELVSVGIPFVATRGYPYSQFFDKFNPDAGLFVDQGELDKGNVANQDGWETALNTIVNEIDERKDRRIDVSEFTLQKRAKDIVKTYEEIIKIN